MSDNTELAEKTCIPCQGNIPPLDKTAADNLLKQLQNDWRINNVGHLHKKYYFKDFMAAMAFANKIAQLAEEEKHHPDLTIAWGSCTVEIWTHKIDGLTESDFILAAKIEALQNL